MRFSSGESASGVDALLGRDDGVVVRHLLVVNVAAREFDFAAREDLLDEGDVGADARGLDVCPQLLVDALREVARGGARVGDELLLVERLRQFQRARGREGVADVGGALQRGQVVEQRRALLDGLLLDLLDRARLPVDLARRLLRPPPSCRSGCRPCRTRGRGTRPAAARKSATTSK